MNAINSKPFDRKQAILRFEVSTDPAEIDWVAWDEIVDGESIFLKSNYLLAISQNNTTELEYRFIRFYQRDQLVGIAPFQITHFESSGLDANLDLNNPIINLFSKNVGRLKKDLKFNVLICGNAFTTGEHGFRFLPEIPDEERCFAIVDAIDQIRLDESSRGMRISACLVKDFYPESYASTHAFVDERFGEFQVDPNMIMPLSFTWNTFDDYLESLVSKFRTKAKGVLKKSADLLIKDLTIKDLEDYRDSFKQLYEQVHYKAEFRLGKLDLEVFKSLRAKMGDEFVLKGYFFDGKLIGFQSGFIYNGLLDAHFVGIDYDLNTKFAIYQRMLYEYIRLGISARVDNISFGRTAMEIKSTVGAVPVDLKVYIRHRLSAPNVLVQLLFSYVKPSEYEFRKPYKKEFEQGMG